MMNEVDRMKTEDYESILRYISHFIFYITITFLKPEKHPIFPVFL